MIRSSREAGLVLRGLREDAGLSRGQLAERAGVSLRWLVDVEHGKPSVDMSKVMDCFVALGFGFDVAPLARVRA